METIKIKNIYGDVIFKHTAENNNVTLTVEAAVSCGVSLANANLAGACLAGADLTGADLTGADLTGAVLIGANLEDANIDGANFNAAHLNGAQNIPYIPLSCPSEGAFVAWKNVEEKYLVKL